MTKFCYNMCIVCFALGLMSCQSINCNVTGIDEWRITADSTLTRFGVITNLKCNL